MWPRTPVDIDHGCHVTQVVSELLSHLQEQSRAPGFLPWMSTPVLKNVLILPLIKVNK